MIAGTANADDLKKTIADINKAVIAIDDSILRDEYTTLHIEEHSEAEGAPPSFSMYYKGDRLIAVVVSVGHETWSKEFRYYYYINGKPQKYVEVINKRPDNPPRVAIIYSENGSVLWKNVEKEVINFSELQNLFLTLQKTRKSFSTY
jgi:hypothetical protein